MTGHAHNLACPVTLRVLSRAPEDLARGRLVRLGGLASSSDELSALRNKPDHLLGNAFPLQVADQVPSLPNNDSAPATPNPSIRNCKMLRAIQARLRMAMHLGPSRRVKRSVTVDNTSKRCRNYDVQIGRFDYGRS